MSGTTLSREKVAAVIHEVRGGIRWKPGSDVRHLLKRKFRGHLSAEATLEDYNQIIQSVLSAPNAVVYVYEYEGSGYPTVVAEVGEARWLVMMSQNSVMESAYVVENPEAYLNQPDFERIGLLSEVLP